jgi:hypothetical protein
MNIRLELIIAGILPATSDFSNQYPNLIKKYPDILSTDIIIHETQKTEILYNKKYQKLVNKCKSDNNNHIQFGKLLGYTEQLDLHKLDVKEVIRIDYLLNNNSFLEYWKLKNHTDMKKELKLLNEMKKVNKNIKLEIDYSPR